MPALHNTFVSVFRASCLSLVVALGSLPALAGEPDPDDPYLRDPDSFATSEAEMKPYSQQIRDTNVSFDMVPIPGGEFLLGSPETEELRYEDEGPQVEVQIEPFWMGRCEVTWDEYDIWRQNLDVLRRQVMNRVPTEVDAIADAVTRPTPEYQPMDFGMGHDDYPAICMTQLAAKTYCEWLTEKTGTYYRLPTEAEWEYACRAGTTTAFSWGDDPAMIDDYAWFEDNSDGGYAEVGQKEPNPWGLYDMHGNVSEWCLDRYVEDFYGQLAGGEQPVLSPLAIPPENEHPRIVRGGSWMDPPEFCRSAARLGSDSVWKIQDPNFPKSMWYHTDAIFVGFRVIRPLEPPTEAEIQELVLYPDVPVELRED